MEYDKCFIERRYHLACDAENTSFVCITLRLSLSYFKLLHLNLIIIRVTIS